jgi:serine/threonine protein phosphatase PrpC
MITVTELQASFSWRSASASARGNVRTHNEDAVLELPDAGLWAVADGLGGHNSGDVASGMVVEALTHVRGRHSPSEFLDEVEDCLRGVNERLFRGAMETGQGLSGSTVAVLLVFGEYSLSIWAGDSRIYRLRGDELVRITHDHSEVQALLDEGAITPSDALEHEAQNVITRAVGVSQELFLDLELRKIAPGDRYLLCTDGLYRELSDGQLAIQLHLEDPSEACTGLMSAALSGACMDNVSVVVVYFDRTGEGSRPLADERTLPSQANL